MLAAAVAGFIDAIAGGGGLITLPALLLSGVSPVEAVATNKLQGTFGVAASSFTFWRRGHVDAKLLRGAIAATAAGALAGAMAVQLLDQRWLAGTMPFLLIAAAIYFAVRPAPQPGVQPRVSPLMFAAFAAGPIGFYDGLFGPGAGSLYMLAFVALAGLPLLAATASTKILNLTSNVVALAVFIAGGQVLWGVGLPMAFGQAAGSWIGSRTAIAHGDRLIRPLIVIVSLVVAAKLLSDPANPATSWLVERI